MLAGQELMKLVGHTGLVNSVKFSPDGGKIISASSDGTIRIWNAHTGHELMKLEGHTGIVNSATFSPGGTLIVSASGSDSYNNNKKDNTIRIWNAQTGREIMKLEGQHHDVVKICINKQEKKILIRGTKPVNSVVFSLDGKKIISASDDMTIRIWDAQTGQELMKINGHVSAVNSIALSPDDNKIVSASSDGTIRIWNAQTGQELMKLEGHTGAVHAATFSPDGQRIVSGASDNVIRIWDVKTGEELMKLEGHTGAVTSAAFSPDGKQIISASHDGTVRRWDFPPLQDLINKIHSRFKDCGLTSEERKRFYLE